jgi:hypothetical protein
MNRTSTFMVAALLGACSTDTDLTNRPLFDNGVNVFEANVIDAITGATVEGATVSVRVGRHVLDVTPEEAGSGSASSFFTIYGIPYGDFRVSATAAGYSDFEALKSFTDSSQNDSLSDGDPFVYYFNNIVMYPEGTVPQGITVSVIDGNNGQPVAGATVVGALTGVGSPVPVSNVLAPNVGLRPQTLTGETAADGKVDLKADDLVIGGNYQIDVFGALDAQGVYLVPSNNTAVTVGQDVQQVLVFLSRPSLTPVALKTNNEDAAGFDPNLQVTFPYAVEICSSASSHTWSNLSGNTNGLAPVATPATTNPVTAALSAGDTLLTLTYNVQSGTDDPADDLRVFFSGVAVKPKGSSAGSCTTLSSVRIRNGSFINTTINVRDV